MSLAHKILEDTDIVVSDEARQRINSARAYDISFMVKKRLGPSHSMDDVDMLVHMIAEAIDAKVSVTQDYIVSYLRSRGRSRHRAEQLAADLLK